MAAVRVKPTKPDVVIARTVSRNTNHRTEMVSRGLTWGADEKILLALATVGWFATRGRSEQLQRAGNHALLVTVVVSLMPHGMKSVFDQTRPDRKTVLGHMHGVSFSGKRDDAFPSGHAASAFAAASVLERHLGYRASWPALLAASYVGASRLVENRHFLSDVVFGAAVGEAVGWTIVGRHGRSEYALEPVPVHGGMMVALVRTPLTPVHVAQ